MKLFWKLLISVESILLVVFTVFGCILMYFSFQNTMERELDNCNEEARFFQYVMKTSITNLPDGYPVVDLVLAQVAQSLEDSLKSEDNVVVVYNGEEKAIYGTTLFAESMFALLQEEGSRISCIRQVGEEYYISTLSQVQAESVSCYLEIDKNITYIYEERAGLLSNYRIAMLAAFVLSLIFTALLSMRIAMPIRSLAKETENFAEGNYKRRVAVKGNDEVSELMRSYNDMAEKLEQTMSKLEGEARRQQDFTAAFAHELKTPLTSVIGYADMLRSRPMADEQRMICADYIYNQGKRLEKLSFKLMELEGIRQGSIVMGTVEVQELVRRVAVMTREIRKEKQVVFAVKADKSRLHGDMDLLLSLFGNLVDNARKACGDHGYIKLLGKRSGERYCFTLRDDGCGIPQEEIAKITEPFYMVDKSRARKEGGAGIGMTLCQQIVRLHGAEWKIESELGKGTTITILFPLERRRANAKHF